MAWLEQATEILRVLINDLGNTPTYTDDILEQTLMVAARYVIQEINFNVNYSTDFIEHTVTPDPSENEEFINFVVLKAACLTNTWQFNATAIIQGITARCGPAQLSVNSGSNIALALLTQGFCKAYEQLVRQYNFGKSDIVRAVLSPFRSNDFQPDTSPSHYRL